MEVPQTESKLSKFSKNFAFVLAIVLVIYLPLYELALHFLQSYSKFSPPQIFWLTHFYEPLIAISVLLFVVSFISSKKLPKLLTADLFVITFLFLAILSLLIYRSDLSRGLEGLRFLALPYVMYLIARFSGYRDSHKLINIYLAIATVLALLGVLEYFLLPAGYMSGFFGLQGFGFGQNTLISTAQATSLLAGPNQLASYLILPFFYLLHKFFVSNKPILFSWVTYSLIIIATAIGLTYSRSALIGLGLAVVLMFIVDGREQRQKVTNIILFLAMAVALAFSYALYNGELLRDLLTHGSSMAGHTKSLTDSFKIFIDGGILKDLFGFGVGSAGPTALKLGGVISENYFFQIAFEVGVVGLLIFLGYLFSLLKIFWKSSKTLFYAVLALIINALFLHIFSDNPAMAVTVFIIAASVVNHDVSTRIPTLN